jgi:DNA-directed RNA polymerase specialized sigma24 family protein
MDPARHPRDPVGGPHDRDLPDDPPSWRAVVRRLLVHARCLGAPLEEAEDLVHDAITALVADQAWFDPSRGDLLGLLKVVVRNRWANRRRSAGVSERAVPRLRLVEDGPTPEAPLTAAQAATHRQRLLALLEPTDRAVFAAWLRQRAGEVTGPEAATALEMSNASYEAAKKRLRRRCRAILAELALTPDDLFAPPPRSH